MIYTSALIRAQMTAMLAMTQHRRKKDGHAVIASDGPGVYPVITESRAGNDGFGVTVTPDSVAYVTTRGPIPDGADAVVQVEDTKKVEDHLVKQVEILKQSRKGPVVYPTSTITVLPTGVELVEPTTSGLSCGQVLYFSENFNLVVEAKCGNA